MKKQFPKPILCPKCGNNLNLDKEAILHDDGSVESLPVGYYCSKCKWNEGDL